MPELRREYDFRRADGQTFLPVLRLRAGNRVALPEGFEFFKQTASAIIYNDARHDIGGDEQRVHDVSTDFSNITFKHLLLPVYAGAYQFNSKTFQIVINGRTGEVQGMRPYSWLKIGALVLMILFIVIILISIFGHK